MGFYVYLHNRQNSVSIFKTYKIICSVHDVFKLFWTWYANRFRIPIFLTKFSKPTHSWWQDYFSLRTICFLFHPFSFWELIILSMTEVKKMEEKRESGFGGDWPPPWHLVYYPTFWHLLLSICLFSLIIFYTLEGCI